MRIQRLLELALEAIESTLGINDESRVAAVLQLLMPHLAGLLDAPEEEARAAIQIELSRLLKTLGVA